jgi:hypothetical protein
MIRRARAAVAALIDRYTFVDHGEDYGVALIEDACKPAMSQGRGMGVGYIVNSPHADNWPDGAALLTIGRLTLAAWLPRKGGAS